MPSPRSPAHPTPAQAPATATPSHRFVLLGTLVLVGLLMAAGGSGAQLPELPALPTDPDVNLSAQSTSRSVERGACVSFQVTVTNSGESVEDLPISFLPAEEITFELTLTSPSQGWRVGETPGSVELERGETAPVTVSLCALEDAPKGERGRMALTATLLPASPVDEEQTDTVTLSAELDDQGVFGIPWDFPPWLLWVVLAAVVVMLAAVVLSRGRSDAGVVLECEESNKEVGPGRGTSFPVRLRNEGRNKDLVSLTTSPVPQGWDTFLPIVDVPLEDGDEQTVWISIKSPEDARDGDHVVVKVFARSSSTAGQQVSLDLSVTVRTGQPGQGQSPWGKGGGETTEDSRSVYEPEDESASKNPRAVAVKRRKG